MVLSITVGVFAVGATLTVQSRLASEMNQNWQRTVPHSGRVNGDGSDAKFIKLNGVADFSDLQFAIALAAPLIAAIAPILSGTRKTVREAISDYGISGQSKVNKHPARAGIPMSRPLAF